MISAVSRVHDITIRMVSDIKCRLKQSTLKEVLMLLTIALMLIAVAIMIRNQGLYAVVFADEYIFSKLSRHVPLANAEIPSYLFYYIYGTTSYCEDGFLGCARILNAFFFASAGIFIFLVGCRVTSKQVAAYIALLSVLAPNNTYTAYFMPESLYFLLFWIFSWAVIRVGCALTYKNLLIPATMLGVAALVKPHALFIIPGLVLYFAYLTSRKPARYWMARWLSTSASFAFMVLATKFVLGFAFAGENGITLFGSSYGAMAGSAVSKAERYWDLLKMAGVSLGGHFSALSLLFGTAVASILFALRRISLHSGANSESLRIVFYTFSVFATLVLVVSLFTASVATMGPYETPFRLHMRYYNFAFPLLLIVAAVHLPSVEKHRTILSAAVIAFPLAAAMFIASATVLYPYTPSLVDSPEARGLTFSSPTFYILSTISCTSLGCWVYNRQLGSRVFLFLYVPAMVIISTYFVSGELRASLRPDVFDQAGLFARQYFNKEKASNLTVMGSNPSGLFRALFYIDDPKANLATIPLGAPADLSMLPEGKEWLLLIGDHDPPQDAHVVVRRNGFSLLRLAGPVNVDFRSRSWPGVVSNIHGLSGAEGWGRWSDSDTVVLEFEHPMPEQVVVRFRARAFGPNVGKSFVMSIGSETASFVLTNVFQEITIPFRNAQGSKSITISVPVPISPLQLGIGGDNRRLGLGLSDLQVCKAPCKATKVFVPTD